MIKNEIPTHVGIIMDGNGRWATRQGKKRTEGHYQGYKTLKEGEMVEFTLIETAKGNQAINVKEIITAV